MSKIKIECAWCGKFIEFVEGAPEQEGETSHGICEKCFDDVVKEIRCYDDDTEVKSK